MIAEERKSTPGNDLKRCYQLLSSSSTCIKTLISKCGQHRQTSALWEMGGPQQLWTVELIGSCWAVIAWQPCLVWTTYRIAWRHSIRKPAHRPANSSALLTCVNGPLPWSLNTCNSLPAFQQRIAPKLCCNLVANHQLCPFSLLLLLHIRKENNHGAKGTHRVLCVTFVRECELTPTTWCHIGQQQSHYPPLNY